MNSYFFYKVHGLNLASSVEFPGWPQAEASESHDAVIQYGEVPSVVPDAQEIGGICSGRRGVCLLKYEGLSLILVSEGRAITVSRCQPHQLNALRVILAGTALAALVYQRGGFCLHASSVSMGGYAYLIAGRSGAGKSTSAAALVERGGTVLADDVTRLAITEAGEVYALPGLPGFRLNPDSISVLPAHARRLEPGVGPDLKRVAYPDATQPGRPVPVARICLLKASQQAKPIAEIVQGIDRFAALRANMFRPRLAKMVGDAQSQFEACARLAKTTDVRWISRPENGFSLDKICALITAG